MSVSFLAILLVIPAAAILIWIWTRLGK